MNCPACAGADLRLGRVIERRGERWPHWLCQTCGHLFLESALSAEAANVRFYEQEALVDRERREAIDRPSFERYWQHRLRWLRTFVDQVPRQLGAITLLDIGAGNGDFLSFVVQAGIAGKGIELSPALAHIARDKGLDVRVLTPGELAASGERFEVITMYAVIEHLETPAVEIAAIRSLLKQGGVLVISTGDRLSCKARLKGKRWGLYTPPEHRHYFTSASLDRLLGRYGFRRLARYSHDGRSRWSKNRTIDGLIFSLVDWSQRLPLLRRINIWDVMFHSYLQIDI